MTSPSPSTRSNAALLLSILAVILALAGAGMANQQSPAPSTLAKKGVSAKKAKKIARAQVLAMAPTLSVASAENADAAKTAESAKTAEVADTVACRSGTVRTMGACIEVNARPSTPATPNANIFTDQASCAALGGRLPSFGELRGAFLEGKIEPGGIEFTADYFTNDDGGGEFTVGYITPSDQIFRRQAVNGVALGGGPDHFRCVFGP